MWQEPLLLLAASVSAPMTLAEASRMSASQLAVRLLGAAGESGNYVEANVQGNQGGMIAAPGLNGVDLYQLPGSAGFSGLCQVDGVHIAFSTSRHDMPGDPPHHVIDFWKFTRFTMLKQDEGAREKISRSQDRDCACLAPVSGRRDPAFFAISGSEKAVDAYFAVRALIKAQAIAPTLGSALSCKSFDADWPICGDPTATMTSIPLQNIAWMKLDRCPARPGMCLKTRWIRSRSGNEAKEVELTVGTDATTIDPPSDLVVVSIAVAAGTWIED